MVISKQGTYLVGALVAGLAVVVTAVANFADPGTHGGTREFVTTTAVAVALTAALFGWYIPRAARAGAAGLTASLLGVVSVAAFWSGLPLVLGGAGAVLGAVARARGDAGAVPGAAIAVGVLACALGVAALAFDQLA